MASGCTTDVVLGLLLSATFFADFVYGTFYFLRLWFEGSKLSYRKRAFLFFMMASLGLCVFFLLLFHFVFVCFFFCFFWMLFFFFLDLFQLFFFFL